jgi:signal transduction histidine kinase
VPIEVSRLRLGLRDALAETEASRERVAAANAVERRRLERDLHDGVQPRLVATGMRLRSLQRHLRAVPSAEIDVAVGELETTVAELRRLAHGVRPSRIDDGLPAALASLRADEPVPVHVSVGELPALDDVRALTAYFVASEAVANAHKHAHASRIEVCVEARDESLRRGSPRRSSGEIGSNDLIFVAEYPSYHRVRVPLPAGCDATCSTGWSRSSLLVES